MQLTLGGSHRDRTRIGRRALSPRAKPLYDRGDDELLANLRTMYDGSSYTSSPNDIMRELDRRAARREGRITMATSVISAVVATIAVILSAIALIMGASRDADAAVLEELRDANYHLCVLTAETQGSAGGILPDGRQVSTEEFCSYVGEQSRAGEEGDE